MSALLALSAQTINICAEYGFSNRNFSKRPRYISAPEYVSALMLVYKHAGKILPHRHDNYRNHFTMYRGKRDILVVRSETTLVFRDNDAILMYDRIEPSTEQTNRFRTNHEYWDISFDREITYYNQRPNSFVDYTLVCSGEWWFFDRGIVLNGITSYNPGCETTSLFIYYELHPPVRIVEPFVTPIISSNSDGGGGGSTTVTPNTFDYHLPMTKTPTTIPKIQPQRILPFLNSTVRPTVQTNDDRIICNDHQTYEAVMPSLYWFVMRSKELNCQDISYFLPVNFGG
nr:GrBNV gp23-like protein [Apis mellifera nudivirus]